jgi:hypothetical protein
MKTIVLTVEYRDHDKVVLTNQQGDTYASKSEELMDFLHGCGNNSLIEYIYDFAWQYGRFFHLEDSEKIKAAISERFQLPEEFLTTMMSSK